MKIAKEIFKRTIALVILKVSGVLAAGSIGGVQLWQSALIASFVGIMEVAESLARAYVVDGALDEDEINTAFASSAEAEVHKLKNDQATAAPAYVDPTVAAPVAAVDPTTYVDPTQSSSY